ncbi:hypothetical protein [Actinoplanes couchii]|nr:hypothetical protein [Actinoplanes couchii]MDR6318912.1 hypothetical protein [Actinoplanes couchii]
MVLSALLLGITGATAGSWLGDSNPSPLPANAEALRLAQEILPGVSPTGGIDRRDYIYGSPLGDEESGPGFVAIAYEADEGHAGPSLDECRLDEQARIGAATAGWEGFHEISGYPSCSNWRAERGKVVLAYTHDTIGSVITFYRPTTGASVGMLVGLTIGLLAGVAGYTLVGRRRPTLTLVLLAIPNLALVPVAALFVAGLIVGLHDGPTPAFWTLWVSLARLFLLPTDY